MNKMMLIGALSLSGMLAATSAMAETTLAVGAQSNELNLNYPGVTLSDTVDGIYADYKVDNTNGFETNTYMFYSDQDGADIIQSYFDASWKWRDMVGPKVAYTALSVDGFGEDLLLGGLTVGHTFGQVELTADVLSETSNFGDEAYVTVGGEWQAMDKLTLAASYSWAGDVETRSISGKFDVTDRVFVEAAAEKGVVSGIDGVDAKSGRLGVGFNF